MGHRLSKTTIANGCSNIAANDKKSKRSSSSKTNNIHADKNIIKKISNNNTSTSSLNLDSSSSGGPRIKVITTDSQALRLETHSESSSSSNGSTQIIIKILLATMESDENDAPTCSSSSSTTQRLNSTTESNNNLNVERSNLTVNAISFQRNIACDQGSEIKLNNLNGGGSSIMLKNNNISNNNFVSNFTAGDSRDELINGTNVQNLNIMVQQLENNNDLDSSQQSNANSESASNRSSMSCSEFSDVNAEEDECATKASANAAVTCPENCKSHCCQRKKSSSPSAYHSKWTYCKGTCADVINKFRPSCSKKQNQLASSISSQNSESQPRAVALNNSSDLSRTSGNQLQIVVVQYPTPSQYPTGSQVVALAPIPNLDPHAFALMAGDLTIPRRTESSSISLSVSPCSTNSLSSNGPTVHSQVDFEHRLVPDLDKITNSTYYWGKMDRYEAERLLEGKPEGTFLLRDSAQEEYLFSVTFRKYGRSLHARIEQFNHEFSFDCHDPGVFTAPTVTGLLEHYKDPSIVMFFEPMLTSPLHRTKTFSLQQLCRATIVSKTTYDGISELEIPIRLKSYLKEYHYKQRIRVKPLDETFYNCVKMTVPRVDFKKT